MTDYPADVSACHEQVELLKKLSIAKHWVSSDLKRASETANEFKRLSGFDGEIELSSLLREQDFGDYERVSRASFGGSSSYWIFERSFRPPGGESFDDLVLRGEIVRNWLRNKFGGSGLVAVFSHGNLMRAVLAGFQKLSGDSPSELSFGYCGFFEIDDESGFVSLA